MPHKHKPTMYYHEAEKREYGRKLYLSKTYPFLEASGSWALHNIKQMDKFNILKQLTTFYRLETS